MNLYFPLFQTFNLTQIFHFLYMITTVYYSHLSNNREGENTQVLELINENGGIYLVKFR